MNLASNFIIVLLFFFAEYGITVSMPIYITEALGQDVSFAGYFTSIFALSAICAMFVCRVVSCHINKMRLYFAALYLLGITICMYPFAGGIFFVFFLRFIQGFSSGMVRAIYNSVTADVVNKKHLGKAIGVIGSATIIAMMVAPPVAFAVSDAFSMTTLFLCLGGLCIVASCLVFFIHTKSESFLRSAQSKPELEMQANNKLYFFVLLKTMSSMGYGLFISFAVLYAKSVGGFNIGLVIAAYALASFMARLLTGFFTDKFHVKILLVFSYFLLFAGYMVFSLNTIPALLFGAFIVGAGSGIESTVLPTAAFRSSAYSSYLKTSSVLALSIATGIGLSSVVGGMLFRGDFRILFIFSGMIYLLLIMIVIVEYYFRPKIQLAGSGLGAEQLKHFG
jgi:predicted MFS family arabinose efflux permease